MPIAGLGALSGASMKYSTKISSPTTASALGNERTCPKAGADPMTNSRKREINAEDKARLLTAVNVRSSVFDLPDPLHNIRNGEARSFALLVDARVKGIAQCVTHETHRQDGNEDEEARNQDPREVAHDGHLLRR